MLYSTLLGMGMMKPGNALHTLPITQAQYEGATNDNSAFIVRLSCEKEDSYALTGAPDLAAGALVTLSLKNASAAAVNCHLAYTTLVEISSSGCQVME